MTVALVDIEVNANEPLFYFHRSDGSTTLSVPLHAIEKAIQNVAGSLRNATTQDLPVRGTLEGN